MEKGLLKLVARERRLIPAKPEALKFGLAVAISLGGILYTFHRTRRIRMKMRTPQSKSALYCSSGNGSQAGGLLKDSDCSLQECNIMIVTTGGVSPRKTERSLSQSPGKCECGEGDEREEIRRLRGEIEILEERERKLEIELLEYYGLKEQEAAVMELSNRLKLNSMEAKLYNLKIESLMLDNKKLEAQVADYKKVVTELDAAKAKIKQLWKKLKGEAEESREQILVLQDRVMKLQEKEREGVKMDKDIEMQLKERKALREELDEMKTLNHGLKRENSDLAHKLEYLQMICTSAMDNDEVEALKEESESLKQENEDLKKQIERLQADRCTDVEELVYLRWINACLRYELRNYQAGEGKTLAKDLSKSLSPRSEEKAKQRILKYAQNKEGGASGEKLASDVADLDNSDQWSPQSSCITDDSPASDILPAANNKTSKPKVFAKLRKLLRGKSSTSPNRPRHLERRSSVDNFIIGQRYSADFPVASSSSNSSRRSFDLQGDYSRSQKSTTEISSNGSRRASDADGSSHIFKRIELLTEDENDWSPGINQTHREDRSAVKDDLVKYAEALKNSHSKSL